MISLASETVIRSVETLWRILHKDSQGKMGVAWTNTIYRDGVKELRDLRDKGKARVAAGETVIDGEFLMLLHRPKSTAPVPIVVPAASRPQRPAREWG